MKKDETHKLLGQVFHISIEANNSQEVLSPPSISQDR